MPKAVRFNHYGGIDVLQVVEVERPTPGPGQVLVKVKAAGINPGEALVRQGSYENLLPVNFPAKEDNDLAGIVEALKRSPITFPAGEGNDLAGIVEALGSGVSNVAVGDEVIGFTRKRASHAEFVVVEAGDLTQRPANVPWEVAGALFIAGTTAYTAVHAVRLKQGDTVAISGAAGGVGSIAVQLAVRAQAKVIGIASATHHQWLQEHGVIPVTYGEGVADRIRQAADNHLDAFIDTFGADYIELALSLGVRPERIDTTINFAAVEKYGVQARLNPRNVDDLAELAALISQGALEIPIARVYPLVEVQAAFRELEQRHTLGKIVLIP
jgi:NADPH:quinone reductase-like Zn-dependent oxidoreductase